jgi:hypothetical protein
VQPHRHMRRVRQTRYDAAAGNTPLGLSRVGLPATPPADAGGIEIASLRDAPGFSNVIALEISARFLG